MEMCLIIVVIALAMFMAIVAIKSNKESKEFDKRWKNVDWTPVIKEQLNIK
mgnify:CR=1 FL=1